MTIYTVGKKIAGMQRGEGDEVSGKKNRTEAPPVG